MQMTKMQMTKRAIVCAAVVSMVLLPVVARAGYKQSYPVSVFIYPDGSGSGGGSLSTARNTTVGSTAYVGCVLTANAGYTTYLYCGATDASGSYFGCYSSDPNLVSVVGSMTVGSDISFNGDASGNCTSLQINNFSYVGPMTP
jgi:hypothetical protein